MIDLSNSDKQRIACKWLAAFGGEVPADIMNKNGFDIANHMWHIFTWGKVPCIEGDEARLAFDELQYERAFGFFGGYSGSNGFYIESPRVIVKLSAAMLDKKHCDVYVFGERFAWTYVKTHESDCGPYFCLNRK